MEDPSSFPYPQYAESTTASVADVLPRGLPMVENFYDHPAYIAALAANVRRTGRNTAQARCGDDFPACRKGAERYELECTPRGAARGQARPEGGGWKTRSSRASVRADWLHRIRSRRWSRLPRRLKRIDVVVRGSCATARGHWKRSHHRTPGFPRRRGRTFACSLPERISEWIIALRRSRTAGPGLRPARATAPLACGRG